MKRIALCVIAAFLGIGMVAFAGQYNVKFGFMPGNLPAEDSPDIMYAETFKKEVEARTNGQFAVTLYPSAQLGGQAEMIQGVMGGYVDMAIIDTSMLNNMYDPGQVLSAPGLFASPEECDAILAGDWGKNYTDAIRKISNIHILDMHCKGFRNFTTSNKELKVAADAQGVTFRVMENPVSIAMVEALGAKAVPMPGSEMYLAMSNGVVDGQENPVFNIIQDKTYEVQKYLVLDGHMAGIMGYIMSGSLYDSLPEDIRAAVDESSNIAMEAAKVIVEKKNREGVQVLRDYGMSVYEPTEAELAEWHAIILEPTLKYIRSIIGDAPVDELMAAIAEYRK